MRRQRSVFRTMKRNRVNTARLQSVQRQNQHCTSLPYHQAHHLRSSNTFFLHMGKVAKTNLSAKPNGSQMQTRPKISTKSSHFQKCLGLFCPLAQSTNRSFSVAKLSGVPKIGLDLGLKEVWGGYGSGGV